MRPGLKILEDHEGHGALVKRHHLYQLRLRMWLNRGEAIRWTHSQGLPEGAERQDNEEVWVAQVRIDRNSLIDGLFHGVIGMKVGGRRKVKISPHLAYEAEGVPGIIPQNAVLIAEIEVLEASKASENECGI